MKVRLIEKPDGRMTRHLPLTVGNVYELIDRSGSNVIITTDEPNLTASIWNGRVQSVGVGEMSDLTQTEELK